MEETTKKECSCQPVWGVLRLLMGWVFLWAFLDKCFGFWISTQPEKAWINGGSPTFGFLKFAATGPLAPFYNSIATSNLVEWLFMLGLLFVGVTLLLGVMVRLGSFFGAVMVFLMWTAVLPPENNPMIDDHIVYMVIMIGLIKSQSGQWLGLGKQWQETSLVKKLPWLG